MNLKPDDLEAILRDLDMIFVEEDSLLNDGKIENSFNSHARKLSLWTNDPPACLTY